VGPASDGASRVSGGTGARLRRTDLVGKWRAHARSQSQVGHTCQRRHLIKSVLLLLSGLEWRLASAPRSSTQGSAAAAGAVGDAKPTTNAYAFQIK